MPCLPSGAHCCIDDLPLRELLHRARFGLQLVDVLRINDEEDLRPWLRFLWLRPVGADRPCHAKFDHRSLTPPDGLTVVDSGYRLDKLPPQLTVADRKAFDEFWRSPRCQSWLAECLEDAQSIRELFGRRSKDSHP